MKIQPKLPITVVLLHLIVCKSRFCSFKVKTGFRTEWIMKITKFTVIRADETRDKGDIFKEGNSLKSKSLNCLFVSLYFV